MQQQICERTCRICGKRFVGKFNKLYCQDCWTQRCDVCGAEMKLTPCQMTTFAKRGWVTCSHECGQKRRHSRPKPA